MIKHIFLLTVLLFGLSGTWGCRKKEPDSTYRDPHGVPREARDHARELIEQLKSGDAQTRAKAAFELGKLRMMIPEAVGPLAKALRDEDRQVRAFAAEALMELSGVAQPAIPDLIEATKDDFADVRQFSVMALSHIAPARKQVVHIVAKILKDDKSPEVRRAAAGYFLNLESLGRGYIRILRRADEHHGSVFISTLGRVHQAIKVARPDLAEAKESDEDENVRQAAGNALAKLEVMDAEIIPTLLDLLKRPYADMRSCAAEVLGDIGDQSGRVIRALTEAVEDEDPRVRQAAEEALKKLKG
ncbi:MAG: HEAT repeat domain-containing protein [Planctomycetota bacterium]|jgi:HEAT repeat protein